MKGIWEDPKTTIVGLSVILLTIAFCMGRINSEVWMGAVGFIAGTRWVLENSKKEEL